MELDYIIILCGCFDDNYTPLSRAEFWKLYHKYGDSVIGIVESDEERVRTLLERSGSIAFAIEKLGEMGIKIITFLDNEFPERLFTKLKDLCPPLLYICGDTNLLRQKYAGYVGSRTIGVNDISWTQMMVEKNIHDKFGIVSGGSKGIDVISINYALENGGFAIAFLPDNIKTWIKDKYYRDYIMKGRLLICSHVSPFALKTRTSFVSSAMERNKYIYVQSYATAVVKSDYNKGGTWAGATEAIKHKWVDVVVWDNKKYEGNQRLIDLGGIPLSDGGERIVNEKPIKVAHEEVSETQMTIFDVLENNETNNKN